jgi:hypothetical protein
MSHQTTVILCFNLVRIDHHSHLYFTHTHTHTETHMYSQYDGCVMIGHGLLDCLNPVVVVVFLSFLTCFCVQ